MLRGLLCADAVVIGRALVKTLMRRIGIKVTYRRGSTSKPPVLHRIEPYLPRCSKNDRPNRFWTVDIAYIPMARKFVCLAAGQNGSTGVF
jgi:putative transposase